MPFDAQSIFFLASLPINSPDPPPFIHQCYLSIYKCYLKIYLFIDHSPGKYLLYPLVHLPNLLLSTNLSTKGSSTHRSTNHSPVHQSISQSSSNHYSIHQHFIINLFLCTSPFTNLPLIHFSIHSISHDSTHVLLSFRVHNFSLSKVFR